MLLAHGITTARDPGGPVARTVALPDSVTGGVLAGQRSFVAGEIIDRTPFDGESFDRELELLAEAGTAQLDRTGVATRNSTKALGITARSRSRS